MVIPDAVRLEAQLPDVRYAMEDGVMIVQMGPMAKDTLVPQHAHTYSHTSMLARGRIRVWADQALVGDFSAPYPLTINANVKHTFQSLEDDTLVYCIHNVMRTGEIDISEEHQLTFREVMPCPSLPLVEQSQPAPQAQPAPAQSALPLPAQSARP